jgi:hypothetical protein
MKTALVNTLFIMILSFSFWSCVDDGAMRRGKIVSPAGLFEVDDTDTGSVDSGLSRPDKAISIIPESVCVCKGTQRVSFGNCDSFCAQFGADDINYLFMRFRADPVVELNPGLLDARGWCTQPIIDPLTGEQVGNGNPGCILKALDQDNLSADEPIQVGDFLEGNFLRKAITLAEDRNWRLSLLETSSDATSKNTVQLRVEATPVDEVLDGRPLKFAPVNQYACLSRGFSDDQDTGDIFFDFAYEVNYYYTDKYRPGAIPATEQGVTCHDTNISLVDRADIPRLKLKEGIFSVWSITDPRFYDNDGVNGIDINKIIGDRVRDLGNELETDPEVFFLFNWPNMPEITDGSPVNSNPEVGFVMTPWIDRSDFKSYCPGNFEYNNSDNPIFRVLKELVGFETEGLYLGVREPIVKVATDGTQTKAVDNFVLIRETLLKTIWFYVQNEQKFVPNDDTVADNTIHFYWPPNTESPLTKKADQYLYTVYYPQELQGGAGSSIDTSGNPFPPHDKKFACIPKTSEDTLY